MEHIQRFHLLARTDEFYRLVDHRADTQCRTATSIAVQLRQYHAVEIQPVVELLGGVYGILTGHGIHDEQRLGWLDSALDSRYLVHHLLIYRQTTCRIDDHHVISHLSRLSYRLLRNLHRITTIKRLGRVTIKQSTISEYFRVNLLAQHAQLLDSRRTIDIASDEHHLLAFLRLQVVRQFRRKSRLTATLQTRHQDDRR